MSTIDSRHYDSGWHLYVSISAFVFSPPSFAVQESTNHITSCPFKVILHCYTSCAGVHEQGHYSRIIVHRESSVESSSLVSSPSSLPSANVHVIFPAISNAGTGGLHTVLIRRGLWNFWGFGGRYRLDIPDTGYKDIGFWVR